MYICTIVSVEHAVSCMTDDRESTAPLPADKKRMRKPPLTSRQTQFKVLFFFSSQQ